MEVLFHDVAVALFNILLIPIVVFSVIFYVIGFSGLRSKKTDPTYKNISVKEWPSVTIQIPTKNEKVAIRCAEKCLTFDYPADKLQIIIGDDSTEKEVSRLIDAFAQKHKKVTVTRRGTNHGFKPGNLNYMLKHTKGDIIVIFDSDFVPEKGFLKEIVKPFVVDKQVACVQAKWKYMNIADNKISKLSSSILMVYHHLIANVNSKLGVSLLFGSGEAIRKSTLIKLGGWQDWNVTEDVEFSLRVLKNGYKTVYLKNLEVSGEVPFTLTSYAKQQKRWAYGNAKAFLDNYRWILFGKSLSLQQKAAIMFTTVGYVSAPLLVTFILLGTMTWFTGNPGDINYYQFFGETGKFFALNSGFIFASLIAMSKERKAHFIPLVILTSLTYGIFVSISVFDGLMKAVTKKKIRWYMIRKSGNEAFSSLSHTVKL